MARERSGEETSSLAVAALIVAAGFLGSRLLGLLRSVIIAHTFGTTPELDAYWVAFRLPDLVFQLLAGATLASAFIPTFTGVRAREGEAAAWRLASSVLNLVFIATAAFALLALLLAPLLVPWMAPGLGEGSGREQELQDLAVKLTRLMLVSPVLFCVSGMFMGILNARRRFLTPALAPMLYNLSIVVGALVSNRVEALAVAVVAGSALHLAVQLPELRLAGMAYRLVADWKDAAVREVGARMAPRVLGLAAAQVNTYFVAIFFASGLAEGAISSLSFAWLIAMTPLGIIGMAISTAAFPAMAEQATRDLSELAATLSRGLRLILYLSLPAGFGLALLARPVVVVLLQRGAFDAASSDVTAQALSFYAPALFAYGGIEMGSRGFYALGDTRTPVAVALGSMLTHVTLAALLVGPLEVRGLALASSVAVSAEFAVLAWALLRRVPGLLGPAERAQLWAMVLASGAMCLVTVAALIVVGDVLGLDDATTAGALLTIGLAGVAGGLTYLAVTWRAGCEEPRLLLRRIARGG